MTEGALKETSEAKRKERTLNEKVLCLDTGNQKLSIYSSALSEEGVDRQEMEIRLC